MNHLPRFEMDMSRGARPCFKINGKRQFLLSGACHYPRSTPEMWREIFRRSRDAGLNCVETVAFWNLHEPEEGKYDFQGRLDVRRWCEMAAEEGLFVIWRFGPYICGESNYGGMPLWLRNKPGALFRTENGPYYQALEKWLARMLEELRPMLASNGGPILFWQIENEYKNVSEKSHGEAGGRYLHWLHDLHHKMNVDVPLMMCNPWLWEPFCDESAPAHITGYIPGTFETINHGAAHRVVPLFKSLRPGTPVVWSEAWTGWYQVWGQPKIERAPDNLAHCVARFFAEGVEGINYYMWHGGTNFGREPMFLQVTSYDYSAPLDEFGHPTSKAPALAALHNLLQDNADTLLGQVDSARTDLGPGQEAFAFGSDGRITFLCDRSTEVFKGKKPSELSPRCLTWVGKEWPMQPDSVRILIDGQCRWYSADWTFDSGPRSVWTPRQASWTPWQFAQEPLPAARPVELPSATLAAPEDQLRHTGDLSDYCWYVTRIQIPANHTGPSTLRLKGVSDLFAVYVDGQPVALSEQRLIEDRSTFDSEYFSQDVSLTLTPGEHELAILCVAIGLLKGEWMIGFANMAEERKGLWGQAFLNGQQLPGPWTLHPFLTGEKLGFWRPDDSAASWQSVSEKTSKGALNWFRAEFTPEDPRDAFALDLLGMGKGLAWVNGQCIGRYWLIEARKAEKVHREHDLIIEGEETEEGVPGQRYYHIPPDWIREGKNSLVLFEEQGGDPTQVRLMRIAPGAR
ncbi:beta-galactosidase [Kamptonema cortianum]|nr:beta-galactosidase [Oscillatoria laete-virens]MDK3157968.1 beta-galactosidase [Kamptonema cortianum]MDL5046093.1 beta-galactosidase [Oscillatoria amoena NRMC-F 0135]MDL5052797.1 beta-galactosidase [Oscillatoria laete-virens NRMC-F 0139]